MQPFAPAFDLPAHIEVEAHDRPNRHHPARDFPCLVLIRGIPGSGKSTLARQLTAFGYRHIEADDYFMVYGRYRYDASRIRQAHDWCRQQTLSALRSGHRVVVANTFTRLCELRPYAQMSDDVLVLWARGRWPNVHRVPADFVAQMDARWEPLSASLQSMLPQHDGGDRSLLGPTGRGEPSRLRWAASVPEAFQRPRGPVDHRHARLRS